MTAMLLIATKGGRRYVEAREMVDRFQAYRTLDEQWQRREHHP